MGVDRRTDMINADALHPNLGRGFDKDTSSNGWSCPKTFGRHQNYEQVPSRDKDASGWITDTLRQ